MAVSEADRLRSMLGEVVPDGGTASDTLFSEEEINDLLDRYTTAAASMAEGWSIKSAKLANLVDMAEGDSKRALSDLHKNALAQAKHVVSAEVVAATGRTKLRRIVRDFG